MALVVSSIWTIKKFSSKSRDEAQWQSAQLRRKPTPQIIRLFQVPEMNGDSRTAKTSYFVDSGNFWVFIVFLVQHFIKNVPVLITSSFSHNVNDMYIMCCAAGYTCMKLSRCSYGWLCLTSDKRFLNPKHISSWHLKLSSIFPVQNLSVSEICSRHSLCSLL